MAGDHLADGAARELADAGVKVAATQALAARQFGLYLSRRRRGRYNEGDYGELPSPRKKFLG
jgi:hypothetical protein